jgi:ATP adenylyltransferase
MERLWSPWRHGYVTGSKPDACVFCAAVTGADEALVVFRGSLSVVLLNRFPYNNGHLLIVPVRHVATLSALTSAELHEIARLTQRAEVALTDAYGASGLNVGLNLGKAAGAGLPDHLHLHVVPRWAGDTNFMPVVGETRVLAEELPATAARLRPVFARLAETAPALEEA